MNWGIINIFLNGISIFLLGLLVYYTYKGIIEKKKERFFDKISSILKPITKELKNLSKITSYGFEGPPKYSWGLIKYENPEDVNIIPDKIRNDLDNFLEIYNKLREKYFKYIKIVETKIIKICKEKLNLEEDYNRMEITFPGVRSYSILYFIKKGLNAKEIIDREVEYKRLRIESVIIRLYNTTTGKYKKLELKINEAISLISKIRDEAFKEDIVKETIDLLRNVMNNASMLYNNIQDYLRRLALEIYKF